MYNKIILVGNLTRDPELKYLENGTALCSFGLAVNRRYNGKETVLFIDVVVWGKQAETVSQYLSKGRQALVEGELEERTWEHEGQKRSRMQVSASAVRFIGGKGGGE